MTDNQPASEPTDANWNRQASTFDWEGWIAEENAADAERAKAKAEADAEAAAAPTFPAANLDYPAPTGAPLPGPGAYPPPSAYPPPVGLTESFTPAPPVSASYGWSSPDGHPMPTGYAVPGAPFSGFAPVPTSRPRDVVSILALIFGILPTVPVGFVLGIVGIVRTKGHYRKGRWMAVTGLILSILWVVGIVAGLAVFGSHLAQRDSAGVVVKKGLWPATDLRVGDCYHDDQRIGGDHHFTTVMPCSQPHNAQVYASVTMTGAHDATLPQRALRSCQVKAATYFKGSTARQVLQPGEFYPDSSAWNRGNHTVMCTAIDPAKDFVGQAKDDH